MTNNKIHKVLVLDKRFLWAEPHVLILHFFPRFSPFVSEVCEFLSRSIHSYGIALSGYLIQYANNVVCYSSINFNYLQKIQRKHNISRYLQKRN